MKESGYGSEEAARIAPSSFWSEATLPLEAERPPSIVSVSSSSSLLRATEKKHPTERDVQTSILFCLSVAQLPIANFSGNSSTMWLASKLLIELRFLSVRVATPSVLFLLRAISWPELSRSTRKHTQSVNPPKRAEESATYRTSSFTTADAARLRDFSRRGSRTRWLQCRDAVCTSASWRRSIAEKGTVYATTKTLSVLARRTQKRAKKLRQKWEHCLATNVFAVIKRYMEVPKMSSFKLNTSQVATVVYRFQHVWLASGPEINERV